MKPDACPACQRDLDIHIQIDGPHDEGPPRDGDVSLCGHCRTALIRDGAHWRVAAHAEVPLAVVARWLNWKT